MPPRLSRSCCRHCAMARREERVLELYGPAAAHTCRPHREHRQRPARPRGHGRHRRRIRAAASRGRPPRLRRQRKPRAEDAHGGGRASWPRLFSPRTSRRSPNVSRIGSTPRPSVSAGLSTTFSTFPGSRTRSHRLASPCSSTSSWPRRPSASGRRRAAADKGVARRARASRRRARRPAPVDLGCLQPAGERGEVLT